MLGDTVFMTLNRLFNETNVLYYGIASELDLPESSFYILYTLLDLPENSSQQDLCEVLRLSKSTVNYAVNVIRRKGFVSLQRAPDSKRKKIISLTDKGSDFVIHNILPIRNAERKACLQLGSDERKAFFDTSKKYIENLQRELQKISPIKEEIFYENNYDQP